VTVVSFAYYHRVVPAQTVAADLAQLASQLRIGVTRLARRLRLEGDASVTPTLLVALATIERHGPMTAGDLAAHERVRKSTVTRLIGALLERGLIERTPDPLDGRVVWLQLSPEGRRFIQRVRRRKDEYLTQRLKRLTPDELATLERATAILERLTEDDR
jgi:DNA-binding MarR family transcriptional regulator